VDNKEYGLINYKDHGWILHASVCRLRKSLCNLKQSQRAWFDMFKHAVCDMGYMQCNGDHVVFYRHNNQKITILIVHVYDIIIIGDDEAETMKLKVCLSKSCEVKDLGELKYFLGIEVATPKGLHCPKGNSP
jgi:hypothetical protein